MKDSMENLSDLGLGKIKCVIWDLDNTLWDGIIIEGDAVTVTSETKTIIEELDARGILQSIASKNDHELAFGKLKEFGLDEYFIYPQINWGPKSQSVKRIAEEINIGMDTLLFIDDQPFEREEVMSEHNEVLCVERISLEQLENLSALRPRFITEESKNRRKMYQSDMIRNSIEDSFEGPSEEFLASLKMVFSISRAKATNLQRLEELVSRTNQLNTTGRIYSYEELDAFRHCNEHELLSCALKDKYGEYGTIGMALLHQQKGVWRIKAFLMSCRVISRGVGSVFLNFIIASAKQAGIKLQADMIQNDRNRMMYTTYRFSGFKILAKEENVEILEYDGDWKPAYPDCVKITLPATSLFSLGEGVEELRA